MSYLLENDINFDGCSVIFYDITKELLSRSKVTFLNQEPLDDVLDVAVCEISDMFDFEQLHLSIGIGGIGGDFLYEAGIHYWVYSRNEHLPKHVHCTKQGKRCKCIIDTLKIEYKTNAKHFLSSEERKIKEYIEKYKEKFIKERDRLNPTLC